ncbi:uncharacterized protein L3040_003689 [Drepanopeziza brunnea f. sp. 'multigermtubi']|uniref:uncharacterized protein n=1 Tax=Drepanopeziza brunnea f. sp. 'multigermtubi' TaxID=698441 RepID=UPI00238D892F|nr:hypothetical protein L3040_003689 [Drepanopeziza brunnea f. sp. 'multigermtubi']
MTTLNIPPPSRAQVDKGYGANSSPSNLGAHTVATDFGSAPGVPSASTLLSPSAAQPHYCGKFNEEWDASQRGSSLLEGGNSNNKNTMQRSDSVMSQGDTLIPSRGGTLKKKASIRKSGSVKRSPSRRSPQAGSVRSLAHQASGEVDETNSAFYSPVPTTGNPTEILANRFQAWRKVLKDLITYFREVQTSYDHRTKALLKLSNIINNTSVQPMFMPSGGIDDAMQVLRDYNKTAIAEANKSKEIENDVILALTGLRSDLNQKIKEIKGLSSDFKNSVDKEMVITRKVVNELAEGLGQSDIDPAQMTGKKDPYLLRLAADRQVEKQIDEENYLHQAYLNLEASGRELEAIVVGEIQKSYNALAGILKREGDAAHRTADELRNGPIAMPKDHEWNTFVQNSDHFVDPSIPIRQAQDIQYPGRDHELAQEVRAGLLERKSKYLKSYTAGWYVLTPTHLHEYKSADKAQGPIMSLYLPEQKLGSHSNESSSSNKFMLKGRQTGTMHRGHSWVFRAESYDTMNAWYEDIRILTEKSPQERSAFVRQHARSVSGTSQRAGSISSDGIMDDEDEEPFSAQASAIVSAPKQDELPRRPAPAEVPYGQEGAASPTHAAYVDQQAQEDGINPYTSQRMGLDHGGRDMGGVTAAGLGGAGMGSYQHHQNEQVAKLRSDEEEQAAREAAVIAAPDAQEQEQRAVREAAVIAAPDSYEQESAALAAREATLYAAPDTHLGSAPAVNGSATFADHAYPEATTTKSGQTSPIEAAVRPLSDDPLPRPSLAVEQNRESVMSVSQLHVPGKYPKENETPLSLV